MSLAPKSVKNLTLASDGFESDRKDEAEVCAPFKFRFKQINLWE